MKVMNQSNDVNLLSPKLPSKSKRRSTKHIPMVKRMSTILPSTISARNSFKLDSFQCEEIVELSNGKESQMSKTSRVISSSSNEFYTDASIDNQKSSDAQNSSMSPVPERKAPNSPINENYDNLIHTANSINKSLRMEKRLLKHLTIENNKQFEIDSNDNLKIPRSTTRRMSNLETKPLSQVDEEKDTSTLRSQLYDGVLRKSRMKQNEFDMEFSRERSGTIHIQGFNKEKLMSNFKTRQITLTSESSPEKPYCSSSSKYTSVKIVNLNKELSTKTTLDRTFETQDSTFALIKENNNFERIKVCEEKNSKKKEYVTLPKTITNSKAVKEFLETSLNMKENNNRSKFTTSK